MTKLQNIPRLQESTMMTNEQAAEEDLTLQEGTMMTNDHAAEEKPKQYENNKGTSTPDNEETQLTQK